MSTSPTDIQVQSAYTAAISGAFNSLFKVLCTFPSRYLFTIGLEKILSFRWYIPSHLRCFPKQCDSGKTDHLLSGAIRDKQDSHLSLCYFSIGLHACPSWSRFKKSQYRAKLRFETQAFSSSFAITWEIPCGFFCLHLLICLNSAGDRF